MTAINLNRHYSITDPFCAGQMRRQIAGFIHKMSMSSVSAGKLLDPKHTVAKVTKVTPLSNNESRFVRLQRLEYTSPVGKNSLWEIAQRTTRPEGQIVDAVVIIPVIKHANGKKEVVLVRQFRPPTNGTCVEFPAGLVDPVESLETCALRELREETGYVGEVRKVSGVVWSDPGLTDASSVMVHVDIDMELEENKNPVPHWMDGEVIEVVTVDVEELAESVDKWDKEGYMIDAKVQAVLIGMSL